MQLVKVAKSVVRSYMDEIEEQTLTKCLVTLINEIEYSQSIGFIPLPLSWSRVNEFNADNDEVEYVANSLVATTKLYETQLNVLDNRYVVAQGLEWSIDAIDRGVISLIIGSLADSRSLDGFDQLPFLTSSFIAEWQESVRKAYEV